MKLLALDTSSLACTVGVLDGDRSAIRHEERPREHTSILMPMIRDALDEVGVAVSDLDAVVLGNGPGSFIGMRIAASVAQGIAFAAGLGIVPVSSMAIVAAAAGEPGDVIAVAQDAHMKEVYLGLYRIGDDGRPLEVAPERLQAQAPIAELANVAHAIAAGAGWQRYPELFEANRAALRGAAETLHPHARELLALGARAFEAGQSVDADQVEPAYLRRKVAATP